MVHAFLGRGPKRETGSPTGLCLSGPSVENVCADFDCIPAPGKKYQLDPVAIRLTRMARMLDMNSGILGHMCNHRHFADAKQSNDV